MTIKKINRNISDTTPTSTGSFQQNIKNISRELNTNFKEKRVILNKVNDDEFDREIENIQESKN